MADEDLYRGVRPLLFSIAYRMVGSVGEAEDIVQDAYLRFHRARQAGTPIEVPKAYLVSVTTRLAIDYLRSARARRESYVGPWLPEPLVEEDDVERVVETADSLSMAFLVLLESLAPVERAVFLLREVFGYDYGEIADIVGKSEANCRQILARARRHVDAGRPRFTASREARDALARRFLAACERGDVEGLVRFLADDVTFSGDGGGKVAATPRPVHGRDRVGGCCRACSPGPGSSTSVFGPSSSTGSRGPWSSTPTVTWSTPWPSTSVTTPSPPSGRWSIPTSCATWAPRPLRPARVR